MKWVRYEGYQMSIIPYQGCHMYTIMSGNGRVSSTLNESALKENGVKAIYFPGAVIFLT